MVLRLPCSRLPAPRRHHLAHVRFISAGHAERSDGAASTCRSRPLHASIELGRSTRVVALATSVRAEATLCGDDPQSGPMVRRAFLTRRSPNYRGPAKSRSGHRWRANSASVDTMEPRGLRVAHTANEGSLLAPESARPSWFRLKAQVTEHGRSARTTPSPVSHDACPRLRASACCSGAICRVCRSGRSLQGCPCPRIDPHKRVAPAHYVSHTYQQCCPPHGVPSLDSHLATRNCHRGYRYNLSAASPHSARRKGDHAIDTRASNHCGRSHPGVDQRVPASSPSRILHNWVPRSVQTGHPHLSRRVPHCPHGDG